MNFSTCQDKYLHHPAKDRTKRLNRAKIVLRKMPVMAIQGFGSFRERLKIPSTTPITAGRTSNRPLRILSTELGMPMKAASNRVRRPSITRETRNNPIDQEASVIFISVSSAAKPKYDCYTKDAAFSSKKIISTMLRQLQFSDTV
jgi:hypothetical protein